MKRKIMAVTLTAAMLAGLAAVPVWADDTGSDEGKVLNIYCWNEEFKSRLTDHYPGYEEVDGTHGKIGDVDVVWNITPSDDNAYQNNLDETLLKQADASADDKIDLFLVEADYALKYVNTDYTMPVADLGITEDEVADQYQYTKDVMTDADGNLKGLSWQGCPGTMIYRRDIAKEVFGTDDPAEVQKKVADWDTFKATAEELKEKGYQMTSTVNDSYRVFSNNVSTPWVVDGKITVDNNIKNWVDMSKEMVDAGETATYELWSDDWSKGFFKDSNVFAYFGPVLNFLMWFGNTTILLMAGMMGIDPSLYEAAEVDGATASQIFRKITLPLLRPILIYVMITSLIGGMQMFDVPQILTNGTGDPMRSTMTLIMYLNKHLFSKNYGMGGALSVFLFIITGVLSLIVFRFNKTNDGR